MYNEQLFLFFSQRNRQIVVRKNNIVFTHFTINDFIFKIKHNKLTSDSSKYVFLII